MRALISVSDKTGIIELARGLQKLGAEIISTGGTAKALREKGVTVKEVSTFTGFPEMMDGRVKTLHPKVHGAILALRDKHKEEIAKNNIELIDIVAVNLYPFQKTAAKKNVALEDAVENIDIGGPTLVRAAAKNYKYVTVVVDPADYDIVLRELEKDGMSSLPMREKLAVKAFAHTADYDAAIDMFLSDKLEAEPVLRLKYVHGGKLRYGENWHQEAMVYKHQHCREPCIARAKQLHGKEMSYNNYVDGDAALEAVKEFSAVPCAAIVKHTNTCGIATGRTLHQALEHAWQGDTLSAFGSVIALSRNVDFKAAEFFKGKFVEAVIAPGFDEKALAFLKEKSKDIMLLEVPELGKGEKEKKSYRYITGGMLEQERDLECFNVWKTVTSTRFSKDKEALAKFTWLVCKHLKSNAIALGYEYAKGQFMLLGMGAGQPNRIDSLKKLAVPKALENIRLMKKSRITLHECVLASDAFFPFDDSVKEAAKHGIRYIVQPGGSKKDEEVIAAANKLKIAMVFTGMRHFLH